MDLLTIHISTFANYVIHLLGTKLGRHTTIRGYHWVPFTENKLLGTHNFMSTVNFLSQNI